MKRTNRIRKAARAAWTAIKGTFSLSSFTSSQWFQGLSSSWTAPTYEGIAKKGFRNPYVSRAIMMIASNMARVPVEVQTTTGGESKTIDNHEALSLLDRPAPGKGRIRFFTELSSFIFISGEFFLHASAPQTGPNRGRPRELKCLRPDRIIEFVYNQMDELIAYRYRNKKGKVVDIPVEEVFHYKTFNPLDDERGFPLLIPAMQAVDLMGDGMEWNKATTQHKGRIPGWVIKKTPGHLNDEQYQRYKEQMHRAYTADSEAGLPGLLEDDFEFMPMATSQKDADWDNMDTSSARKIAVALGVDPALLGDSANKTYSNLETALKALYIITVIPMLEAVLDDLSAWLLPRFGTPNATFVINRDEIDALQEDQNERYTRLGGAVTNSLITIDEARKDLGKDPIGGPAGMLWGPFNRTPLVASEGSEGDEMKMGDGLPSEGSLELLLND